MKKISIFNFALCTLHFALCIALCSCEPKGLTEDQVFIDPANVESLLAEANPEGYKVYTLDEFVDAFMTVEGTYSNDTTPYRTRSKTSCGWELFAIDTLPSQGPGIYIRGRITTDDFGGNFYKSLVIQQIVDGEQQNLRISVDMGSASGMYPMGQEILIRCNGLCLGRYANQPQLCVPSYNNNIFANNATEKVGWAPGRIPSAVFRNATMLIGTPDPSKLRYDKVTLKELFEAGKGEKWYQKDSITWYREVARLDGRLVTVTGVHFTGEYENNGSFVSLTTGNPKDDTNANVFAPTTTNIGYPQSRVIANANNSCKFLVSNSEYAKFARFYIPGANASGVTLCSFYEGSVTGILGWYLDNARYATSQDGYEWSITPRGILGFGPDDIRMYNEQEELPWTPLEYTAPKQEAND